MKANKFTVKDFFRQFPDDNACLAITDGDAVRKSAGQCPKCSRETKFPPPVRYMPAYSCQYCGHHIHPMVGTPFEKTRTPLQMWFYGIYLFSMSRHGVPAKELQRQLGVTYKTAWRMGHEIRKYMGNTDGDKPLGKVRLK